MSWQDFQRYAALARRLDAVRRTAETDKAFSEIARRLGEARQPEPPPGGGTENA
ncbi:MAG: hypothetical protein ACRDT4_03355 [Micromonosporaceae bacterium]